MNIAVHQGSKETLGISLSIALIRSGFFIFFKVSRQNQLGGEFFQDQVESIQIMNLLFHYLNWLRIRYTDCTLSFYVSFLATPQPEHRES